MLFKLLGSAKVLNVKSTSNELASIQVIASRKGKTDEQNGSRWITIRGKAASFVANQGDKLKGALVHIDATATTNVSSDGNQFYENYSQTELNVLAWPDNAKQVKTQLLTLVGSGRVINVKKVSDNVASIQVISSIKQKNDQEIKSTRWLKVFNESAKFWINNADDVMKSIVHFEANVVTNNHNNKYYSEYIVKGHGLTITSWSKTNTPAANDSMGYPSEWDHEYVSPDEMDQAMAANQ